MHAGALELADRAAASASRAVDMSRPFLQCPVCYAMMTRLHLGGTTVEVDRCDTHGTWFDRNELRAAAQQVASQRSAAAPGAVAAVGAGEYSLSNDPRFAEAFSDEGDDDDDEGGVGTGVALAGAFVLFEVLVDFLSDS